MSRSTEILVVGAGVFGAWTAQHLNRLGRRVLLVDAFAPAHARASSGGESRLIRAAYGRDAIYTRMARDSLPEWKALSTAAACGRARQLTGARGKL
jgi:glycine/D-amino acid oxidase-like deaminating enzyme